MNDTTCEEDVGVGDGCVVDHDRAVGNGDLNVIALKGSQGGVAQVTAVSDSALNDVVRKDVGELVHRQVAGKAANVLEGRVGWCEDGQVLGTQQGRSDARVFGGTEEGSQIGILSGRGEVTRDHENIVNDVDHTVGVVDILVIISSAPEASDVAVPTG